MFLFNFLFTTSSAGNLRGEVCCVGVQHQPEEIFGTSEFSYRSQGRSLKASSSGESCRGIPNRSICCLMMFVPSQTDEHATAVRSEATCQP